MVALEKNDWLVLAALGLSIDVFGSTLLGHALDRDDRCRLAKSLAGKL